MKLCILFHCFGPYHISRLVASGLYCELHAIEVFSKGDVYEWDKVEGSANFNRITLLEHPNVLREAGVKIHKLVFDVLNSIQPDVVAVPGWFYEAPLAAISWCISKNKPVILMSDSNYQDKPRKWWKEFPKRRCVRLCGSGLVAGSLATDYLHHLGIPREKIWTGYDVVENDHFTNGAKRAQSNASGLRQQLNLAENYFLSSNRFVEKKNLPILLRAYASYKALADAKAWKLVLLGDGPLRPTLLKLRKELNLEDAVLMPGFKQYDNLTKYYGLANAFVHTSTFEQWGLVVNEAMASGLPVLVSERCGCVPELVLNGENGFTFNPYREEELAARMLEFSSGKHDHKAMGEASRRIISKWSPETFATNLLKAAEAAMAESPKKASWLDKAILQILIRR